MKTWVFLVVSLFLVGGCCFATEIKNPDRLVYVNYQTINTLDPHYCYDSGAGGQVIYNTYENLVMWKDGVVDANEVDLSYSLDSADLLPMLSTEVPTVENGLANYLDDGSSTYTFPIRSGVKFHLGGTLTAEDVEYSFERGILQDRDGGPMWLIIEALTGKQRLYQLVEEALGIDTNSGLLISTLSPEQQAKFYSDVIDPLVEVDGSNVVFHLRRPFPPFLINLSHGGTWGAILDKEWVIEVGGWDGKASTWANWYNPGSGHAAQESALYDITNGTGPYRVLKWDPGIEVIHERFDEYWREPAKMRTVVNKKIQEWADRLLLFRHGDVDICVVDSQYLSQVESIPGIVVVKGLPTINMNPFAAFVSDFVVEGNELIGDGAWGEGGISPDFFKDVHLRRAFAYALDDDEYIDSVAKDGYKTHGPVPKVFRWAYEDDPGLYYNFDMDKAVEEMKLAHGGRVWDEGFTFTILYSEGAKVRGIAAEILEHNIEAMNPKFHVDIRGVPFSTYIDRLVRRQMPMYFGGWYADYPDPHDFAMPFYHSTGTFSGYQGDTFVQIFKERYDPLIALAIGTSEPAERADLYYQIEEQAYEDCLHIWCPQQADYRVMRDWIQGFAFNPSTSRSVYYYSIYKAYE